VGGRCCSGWRRRPAWPPPARPGPRPAWCRALPFWSGARQAVTAPCGLGCEPARRPRSAWLDNSQWPRLYCVLFTLLCPSPNPRFSPLLFALSLPASPWKPPSSLPVSSLAYPSAPDRLPRRSAHQLGDPGTCAAACCCMRTPSDPRLANDRSGIRPHPAAARPPPWSTPPAARRTSRLSARPMGPSPALRPARPSPRRPPRPTMVRRPPCSPPRPPRARPTCSRGGLGWMRLAGPSWWWTWR